MLRFALSFETLFQGPSQIKLLSWCLEIRSWPLMRAWKNNGRKQLGNILVEVARKTKVTRFRSFLFVNATVTVR